MTETNYESAVAIIGMSGRFPNAGGVDELWRNLAAGRRGLRTVTEEELSAAGVSPALMANPAYVRTAAPLDGIEFFDASLFGFSRREAESTEPQHRLFLECSWEALESAGYAPNHAPGKVGVFAGCGYPDYLANVSSALANEAGGGLLVAIGTERDSLASMVSYKLDLRGPSLTVQTFCSTSLVAVHLAVQSLLTFESDMAIAGGAYVALPQPVGYLFEEGSITTPDGRVRSFDAGARGTVLGNGVAVVALKRMTEALADGDVIHAVILGSAVNNDGRACAGYTAPGVDGQAEVIELALGVADVKPETIGYVECHATGTMLGDSIELAAMSRVFQRTPATPTVLGALKPSIGHLDRASGVTGLIRTTMALGHGVLPATPDFETPNPTLSAAADRFQVLTEPRPWPAGDHPRRAGVSSFGFGGTNAHVVLEEAPAVAPAGPQPGPHLLVLSARDLTALYAAVEQLQHHLEQRPDINLADVAYTLQQSRTGFPLRWAAVCTDHADALATLADPGRWIIGDSDGAVPVVDALLPAPDEVPQQWWRDLLAAARPLAQHAAEPADVADGSPRPAAVRAALAALARLGMRLGSVTVEPSGGADPADAELAGRLAAEFGAAPGGEGAVELLIAPDDDESAAQWLLAGVARMWQAGTAVNWTRLAPEGARRVTLPTYPFQRRRYWVEPRKRTEAEAEQPGKTADRDRWTHLPSWRRRHAHVPDLTERLRAASPWLVLAADERAEAVVRQLTQAGADVTTARPGERFARVGPADFVVRPDSADDMRELLGSTVLAPRTVVHGFALAAEAPVGDASTAAQRRADGSALSAADRSARFDRAQSTGFYSVLALAGAIEEGGGVTAVDLVVLTDGAVAVSGGDLRHPAHAALAGLTPVLGQENPGLSGRHVDLDPAHDYAGGPAGDGGDAGEHGGRVADRVAGQILAEAVTEHLGPVAWRAGARWLRSYEQQPLPAPADGGIAVDGGIPAGGTVLITGGLGNVGMILARHLAATRRCRLVLTTRSPLPPRQTWSDLLAVPAADRDKITGYVARVVELEEAGAEVMCASADVADAAQMAAVVRAAEERFGAIDAVVHGAGVQDARFFGAAHTLGREACDAHFRAKVHGFHVLDEVLRGRAGRRITLSSLSTVLGGIGFGPYAASNAALDAAVLADRDGGATSWQTVDWDAWRISSAAEDPHRTSVAGFEMAPDEGADIFERALAAAGQVGHLVISTGSLDARLKQWVIRPAADPDSTAETGGPDRDPRPALPNPYVQPAEGIESDLAEIWAAVLGLEKVGAQDDFYRLGGDSVTAIDLVARVRRQLQAAVPVTALLEHPTVRELAVRIAAPSRAAA